MRCEIIEKSVKLTVDDLLLLCKTLKKQGHGHKVVYVGYDSNYVYTCMSLYSQIAIEDDCVWIDEYDWYYHDRKKIKDKNCIEMYLKNNGDGE